MGLLRSATEKANVHDLVKRHLVHPDDEVIVSTMRLVGVDASAGMHPEGIAIGLPSGALCFSHRTLVLWGRKIGTTQWAVCHVTEVRRFGDSDLEVQLRNPSGQWATYTLRFADADTAAEVAAQLLAAKEAITAMTEQTGIADDGISRREWSFIADFIDACLSPNQRDLTRALEAWQDVQVSEKRLALYLLIAAREACIRRLGGPPTIGNLSELSLEIAEHWPIGLVNDDDIIYRTVLTVCELAEPGTEVEGPANNLVKAGVIATLMGTDLDDLRAAVSVWVRGHETFMIEHDIHP